MASALMRTCGVATLKASTVSAPRRVQQQAQQARQVSAEAHNICVLPGDGIGPEIMAVAVDLLHAAGKKEGVEFEMSEQLIGGAAIDGAGSPYPQATEDACKASDAVLLAAIGGCDFINDTAIMNLVNRRAPPVCPEHNWMKASVVALGINSGVGSYSDDLSQVCRAHGHVHR
jgi:hypothetical protein